MSDLLKGKIAVVTGAGSGIGRATAEAMAREGAQVIVLDRNSDAAARTVEIVGGGASFYHCEITDRAGLDALARQVEDEHGRIDILVNCAAIIRRAPVESAEAREVWDAVTTVNLDGTFNTITAFRAALVRSRGAIINLASTHAFVAAPQTTAYTAAKGAIHALTFSLAAELGPSGVRVNAVAPGFTLTPMNEGIPGFDFSARFGPRTPLGRPAEPDDIAQPIVFLASDMARYITGVTLRVDGGYLCY